MPTFTASISAVYIALSGLLLLALSLNVIRHRRRAGVGLGDGGDKALLRAIRAHGNATETIPIQLLLLLALELAGFSALLLHALGVAILLSRGLHAIGLAAHSGPSFGRMVGMAISLLLNLLMPLLLIAAVLGLA